MSSPTDYERFWQGWGDSLSGSESLRGTERILVCPQCDEMYAMSAADATRASTGLGHRANCWILGRWYAGVDAGVFDPTGSTGGGGGDPGDPDPPGGGSFTFDSTTAYTFDSATVPTFDTTTGA